MSKKIDWSTATIEDLMANPNKYGAPTYEQFVLSYSKYQKRGDEAMVAITEGPQSFRKDLNTIKFQINGVELPNEEAVEMALLDHGYSLMDIDLENRDSRLKKTIEMVPQGGGKYDIVVNFIP